MLLWKSIGQGHGRLKRLPQGLCAVCKAVSERGQLPRGADPHKRMGEGQHGCQCSLFQARGKPGTSRLFPTHSRSSPVRSGRRLSLIHISRKLYNPYTVFYHTFFDLKLVYEVGPESFLPPPTVKSALLNIDVYKRQDSSGLKSYNSLRSHFEKTHTVKQG